MNHILTSFHIRAAGFLILSVIYSGPLTAQPRLPKLQNGTVGIYMENDMFAGTDQHYTSGVKLSWSSNDLERLGDTPYASPFLPIFDLIPYINQEAFQKNLVLSLGQNIYTPQDILKKDLIENDRPYAGWLYLGVGVVWKNEKKRNLLVLNIGVVGPWALGEDAQNYIHKLRGLDQAEGWDNQLNNELGVAVTYERTWRWLYHERRRGWDWEILPHAKATLGNVHIFASGGVELRAGWNLPEDFGTAPIGPTSTTSTPVESAPSGRGRTGIYFFTRAEGYAVARDIFLDGNTFSDSHSVSRYPFYADLSVGFATNYKNTKLAYAYVYRTKQFREQEDEQIFGTLSLNWNF